MSARRRFNAADQANVAGLRWRLWGRHKAIGNGTFVGNMGFREHVKVKLTRPRHGWPHRRLYFSKLRLRGSDVSHAGGW